MTEHDPLCWQPGLPTGVCFECADIQTIRSDERERAVQRVEALPHSLECVTRDPNYSRPCNCLRSDALDAIKGDEP